MLSRVKLRIIEIGNPSYGSLDSNQPVRFRFESKRSRNETQNHRGYCCSVAGDGKCSKDRIGDGRVRMIAERAIRNLLLAGGL